MEETFEEVCLFHEFTGLMGWEKGGSMQPHADNNRDYLTQRHYSAVLYLNTSGIDFLGGNFHFCNSDGVSEMVIVPTAGLLVIFDSGSKNIHKFDEITAGNRFTLTMWFTRDKVSSKKQ